MARLTSWKTSQDWSSESLVTQHHPGRRQRLQNVASFRFFLTSCFFSTRIPLRTGYELLGCMMLHDAAYVIEAWSGMCHVSKWIPVCTERLNQIGVAKHGWDCSQVLARNADFDIDSWKKAGAWEPWLITSIEACDFIWLHLNVFHTSSSGKLHVCTAVYGVNGSMQLSHVVTCCHRVMPLLEEALQVQKRRIGGSLFAAF